jgi:hypothetical protein
VQESKDDIQNDGKNDRNQNTTREWKIERAVLAFDVNITGQVSERDAEF